MTAVDNTTSTLPQINHESFNICNECIDYINSKIFYLIKLYHLGNFVEANSIFIEIVDLTNLYTQLVLKICSSHMRSPSPAEIKDDGLEKVELHLLSTVKALLSAKEKNDILMLCDLLEYELMTNLNEWKDQVLPKLKKLKKT